MTPTDELRMYWITIQRARMLIRENGPDHPEVAELLDDLDVIRLYTDQPSLRSRIVADLAALPGTAPASAGVAR